ncbi:MAG: lipoate--protein ligase family protein [Cyanobacteria bacterium P01_H01_bin.162]
MALDTLLLEQLIANQQAPTLRFYRWHPVAVSLGYHQKDWPQHWQSLSFNGQSVDLVRRPSGGRAVMHQGDLTYAIALPMTGSRDSAYRQICDALIAAWQRFDVALDYGRAGGSYRHQANCFALATAADLITPAGYKLIGSAQLRRDRYLLQHGSLRLWPDAALSAQVFGKAPSSSAPPPAAIPQAMDEGWLAQLSAAIVEELARSLNVRFVTQPLSPDEQTQVAAKAAQFTIPAGP